MRLSLNFSARDVDNKCPLASAYVFAMGGYQMVFGVSWGHHFLFRPYDLDVSSMISGLLGIAALLAHFSNIYWPGLLL